MVRKRCGHSVEFQHVYVLCKISTYMYNVCFLSEIVVMFI